MVVTKPTKHFPLFYRVSFIEWMRVCGANVVNRRWSALVVGDGDGALAARGLGAAGEGGGADPHADSGQYRHSEPFGFRWRMGQA